MRTMMALRAHTRGGPEQLVYEQAPRPEPAHDEIIIAVHAAAITFAELTWEETWSHLPAIPSHEVSGIVAQCGRGVRSFDVGDEVYGLIRFDRPGAAADYVAVPAADLAPRPRKVSHVEAAAVPLAALTAWQALVDHAELVAGERVLVLGGAGGVGGYAVQLAHGLGALVTATALPADIDAVRLLGADHVLDGTTGLPDGEPYDVVIDTIGGKALDRAYALARGGRLITLQAPPSQSAAAAHDVTATFFVVTPDAGALRELAALVDSGALSVRIAGTFALDDGRDAFESGAALDRTPGKTVLVVRT